MTAGLCLQTSFTASRLLWSHRPDSPCLNKPGFREPDTATTLQHMKISILDDYHDTLKTANNAGLLRALALQRISAAKPVRY